MAKRKTKANLNSNLKPVALGVAGGTGVGLILGRIIATPSSAAMTKLVEALVSQAALSTAAPILGTAIVGGCSIISAVAIPATVIWMISREEKYNGKENKND